MDCGRRVRVFTVRRFLLVLLVLLASAAPAAAELACTYCGGILQGDYFKIDREGGPVLICAACKGTLKSCKLCGIPVKDGESEDGMPLCAACRNRYRALPVCSYCGKRTLAGGITIAERDLVICKDCKATRRPCAMCQLPLGLPGDGPERCAACEAKVAEAPGCAICGGKILDSHVVFTDPKTGLKRHICKACYESNRRCDQCGVPSPELTGVAGKSICPECLGKLNRCSNCGAPMLRLYSFLLTDKTYCEDCVRRFPQCETCGAPAGTQAALPDGRYVCADCLKSAVEDVKTVEGMLAEIRGVMEKSLRLPVREFGAVSFADKQEMIRLFEKGGARGGRMETYPTGLFERHGETFNIYVLPHVRVDVLRGVLTHEFAHAFMNEYYPSNEDLEENEGFCEWVRYRFMQSGKDERGVRALQERDDFYGKAFRKILAVEKKSGVAGVFDFIGRKEPVKRNPLRK